MWRWGSPGLGTFRIEVASLSVLKTLFTEIPLPVPMLQVTPESGVQGQGVRPGDIADVDVILFLLAVTVYGALFTTQYLSCKNRHHASFTPGVLARAVDVPVAKNREIDPARTVGKPAVLLAYEF